MKEELITLQLETLNHLYRCKTCVVIGSGRGSNIELLQSLEIKNVILIEADERQIEKMQKRYIVPNSYVVHNALIHKDEEHASFNITTNPVVNCFKSLKTYKNLMPNTSLIETLVLPSYTLATYLKKLEVQDVNWLVIETFTAKEILTNAKAVLDKLDVIVCTVFRIDQDSLSFFLREKTFKLLKILEENNPSIVRCIYVKDFKSKTKELDIKNTSLEEQVIRNKKLVEQNTKIIETEKEVLQLQVMKLEEKFIKEQNIVKEIEKKRNLDQKQLRGEVQTIESQLAEYKSAVIITDKEFGETEYMLKHVPPSTTVEMFKLIALAENSLKHKQFQTSIYYWQKLASFLGTEMPQLYYKRLAFAYGNIGGYPVASEEEEILYGTFDKHEMLKQLHDIIKPKFYMEIGVQTGKSLRLAECRALGIDPMPLLSEKLKLNMEVQEQTSDAFFETYAKSVLTEPLDLVFIDGMHLFEYALRDFINVESYASQNTIIVIDDIYPGHPCQAERDRKTRAWTGDVWKVLAILKEYRKDLIINTLDIYPTGLMVIQKLDSTNKVLQNEYQNIVKKYTNKKIDKKLYIERSGSLDPIQFIDGLKENSK